MSKVYMVALEVEVNFGPRGIDQENVAKEVARLVEVAAKSIPGVSIETEVFNPGEEIDTDFIDPKITDVGCGEIQPFVTVDFGLDGSEIVVESVTLDTETALEYLNENDAMTVRVTTEEG
jgi:hypothetical protein